MNLKPCLPAKLKKHRRSGIIEVKIHTQHGVRWLSTGQTSYAKAREVCTMGRVEELQMLACADGLTNDALSRMLKGNRFSCADILEAWKVEGEPNVSPTTLANYEGTLRQWIAECRHGSEPLSALKRRHLSEWVNAARIPVGTRRSRLAALRSFYKYAAASGYIVGNPASLITIRTHDLYFTELEAGETNPMMPEEYERLMTSPKVVGFWRFAVPISYWLGLRLKDVACLEWASIQENQFVIFPKKTGRRLALPLDDPLLGSGVLQSIFAEMRLQSTDPRFCFPKEREVALDMKKRAKLSVYFQRILKRVGIKCRRFHSLRHAMAMRLKDAGQTVDQIGQYLGHNSAQVTKIYTEHKTA